MFERTFTVKYLTLKKCFCYVSDKQTKAIDQGSAVKLTSGNRTFYFTIGNFLGTLKETEIGINGVYAKSLGLKEKEPIIFSLCTKPIPGVKTLDITPNNKDDYEILELMANDVQSTLLNQLRIVQNNQKVVIWISNSLNAVVNVDGVKPVSPGRLDQLTEVVIKPPVVHTDPKKFAAKEDEGSIWSINGFLKYFAPNKPVQEESILDIYKAIGVPFVFRLHPLDDVLRCRSPNLANNNSKNVFNVYASKNVLPRCVQNREDLVFSFRPILPPRDFKYTDDNDSVNEILVRLCLLDDIKDVLGDGNEYFKPLFVDEGIFNHYGVEVGSKVLLRHVDKVEEVNKIEICTSKGFVREIKEKFKFYIGENCKDGKLILNSNFVINISDEHQVLLKFTPNDLKSCFVDGDFVRNGQLSVGELQLPDLQPKGIEENAKIDEICLSFTNFKEILDGCQTCLNIGCKDINNLENILITGKAGCGKSTLVQEYSKKISSSPIYIHIESISCKEIKGKTVDSLHKFFEGKFMKLVYYQPSLLILDDLHVICENVNDGEEPTQQNLLFNRASEILASLLNDLSKKHFIQIIATAESTLKLNKNIFDSRGVHFFKNIFTIKELNKIDRIELLKFMFEKDTNIEDVDLENLSIKTEGYVAQDLVDFVNKCIFESYKDELTTVNNDHCLKALEASSSLSLRNVQLHTPGHRDFSDIGGLDDVKKVLIESMLWPAQYANIFANAPLRLQSGLLLYGPPGTGKTILAGAAAKQCNLRLISIKGPELLSKYIGASEQAVRDVFEKAQSAKPCILFFDEFDSLAPRRGHDNTGVTDRVVNQFLTQLDGVESLTGVCVLAATSRPDLLDPALLRPGRLDKQILCPLPDQPARLAILKSLSKTLKFSNDVDLGEIASATHGFSGADLQAVLYTAQMSAVEHLLDESVPGKTVSNISIMIKLILCSLLAVALLVVPSFGRSDKKSNNAASSENVDNFKNRDQGFWKNWWGTMFSCKDDCVINLSEPNNNTNVQQNSDHHDEDTPDSDNSDLKASGKIKKKKRNKSKKGARTSKKQSNKEENKVNGEDLELESSNIFSDDENERDVLSDESNHNKKSQKKGTKKLNKKSKSNSDQSKPPKKEKKKRLKTDRNSKTLFEKSNDGSKEKNEFNADTSIKESEEDKKYRENDDKHNEDYVESDNSEKFPEESKNSKKKDEFNADTVTKEENESKVDKENEGEVPEDKLSNATDQIKTDESETEKNNENKGDTETSTESIHNQELNSEPSNINNPEKEIQSSPQTAESENNHNDTATNKVNQDDASSSTEENKVEQ